jgi:putative peptidoglycan lipid II flippase
VLIRVMGYPDSTNFAYGPFGGLALAMSLATGIETTTLWIILRRRIGGLDERRVLGGALRTLIAAGVMAAAVALFLIALPDLPALIQVPVIVAVGGAIFWGVAMKLDVEQADQIPRLILRRLGR